MPAARSAMEILPVPFEKMELGHVRAILDDRPADEAESLLLEVKELVDSAKLAKSCAAFANTLGGLLIVGVSADGAIVGWECPGAEAQVWVKDVLRPLLVPMPPFRARLLPTGSNSREGVMLVLVEYSSTTPHVLTKTGSIMVRRPASSEPLPLNDQRTLLDLMQRGERAREMAVRSAAQLARNDAWPLDRGIVLALVPTGVPAEWVEAAMSVEAVSRLLALVRSHVLPDAQHGHTPVWEVNRVSVELSSNHFRRGFISGSASLGVDGPLVLRNAERETPLDDSREFVHVLQTIEQMYLGGRALLSELGANGDLRVALRVLYPGQDVVIRMHGFFSERDAPDRGQHVLLERELQATAEEWGSLASAAELIPEDNLPLIRIERHLRRSLGLPPD